MRRPAVQGRDDIVAGRATVALRALAVAGWLSALAGCAAPGSAQAPVVPPTSPPPLAAQGATAAVPGSPGTETTRPPGAEAAKTAGAAETPAGPAPPDGGPSSQAGAGVGKPEQAEPSAGIVGLVPPGAPAEPRPAAPSPATPAGSPDAAAPATEPKILLTLQPGLYRCELNRRVTVRRVDVQARTMVINWQGRDSTLTAVTALSGALRFENPGLGLVWITIVGKSLLLDSKAGRTLANECRL